MTDSAETTPRNLMKLGDMEELSLEWCRKPVFLVFYVRNITHPCILCLTYPMFTLLSLVVYISQLCRLHNSVIPQTYLKSENVYITQSCCLNNSIIPQTYPKIGKLNSGTLKTYIEDHLINIKRIQIN